MGQTEYNKLTIREVHVCVCVCNKWVASGGKCWTMWQIVKHSQIKKAYRTLTHTALDGAAANQMPIAIQLTIQVEGRTGSKTRQGRGHTAYALFVRQADGQKSWAENKNKTKAETETEAKSDKWPRPLNCLYFHGIS